MSDELIPLSDVIAPAAANGPPAPSAAASGNAAPAAPFDPSEWTPAPLPVGTRDTGITLSPTETRGFENKQTGEWRLTLPTPGNGTGTGTTDAASSLIPLSDVTTPAAAPPAAPSPEQSHTFTALGPLNGPANALQGFTEQAGRAATLGLQDKVGAAAAAVKPAISAVSNSLGREWLAANPDVQAAPDNSAPQPSVSDAYHADLANERGMGQTYAANHPIASKAATTIGTLATIPLTSGTSVPSVAAREAGIGILPSAAPATLGAKMLQGAGQGATIGALSGFGNSNDQSLGQTAVDTGIGGLTGGAIGTAIPAVAQHIAQPLIDMVARRFGTGAVDNQAVRQITQRLQQDQTGGGPGAQDVLDLINAGAATGKPLTIADLGGQGVKGLGERIANQPGPGQQFITDALTQRNLGEGSRLESDINAGISGGNSHYSAVKALEDSRAAAAGPLYDAAYSHPGNKAMVSPMIDRVLETPAGKRALAAARVKMQNDMSLMGKPDAELGALAREQGIEGTGGVAAGLSLRTLDYVKRAMDDQIGVAMRGGEKDEARILIGLKNKLLSAVDDADATKPKLRGMLQQFREQPPGKYAQARAAYSGPTKTADAVNEGALIFKKHPDQIREEIVNLSPGDREFYKLGAASALRDQIAGKGTTSDEAKLLVNSRLAQSRIRPIFDDEESFQRFMKSFEAENTMHRTYAETLGNSRTLRRAAEAANGGEGGAAGHLVRAGAAAMEGAPVAATLSGIRGLMGMLKSGGNPKVDLSTAQSLFSTDPAANRALLARIIAGQNAPSMAPSAAVPLASLGAQGAKGLLRGYQGR